MKHYKYMTVTICMSLFESHCITTVAILLTFLLGTVETITVKARLALTLERS